MILKDVVITTVKDGCMEDFKIRQGCLYKSKLSWDPEQKYLVTAVGLNHVLITDYPLIKINEDYLEHCLTYKQFKEDFAYVGEVG